MSIVCLALLIFQMLVLAAIVLSWFPPGGEGLESVRRFLNQCTEWALGPLRRAIPPVRLGAMALDLSPLIVLFGVSILRGLICR
jgi:YggT family protein